MNYWYTKEINLSFEEALDDITFSLSEQGFWVLTKIDMQESMKTKLDKEISKYIILWACNPSLAYEWLKHEQEIWLLLPCNVIVYEKDWKVFVSAFKPSVFAHFIKNEEIIKMTKIAEEKLKNAIDNI